MRGYRSGPHQMPDRGSGSCKNPRHRSSRNVSVGGIGARRIHHLRVARSSGVYTPKLENEAHTGFVVSPSRHHVVLNRSSGACMPSGR